MITLDVVTQQDTVCRVLRSNASHLVQIRHFELFHELVSRKRVSTSGWVSRGF
jgi:hypothetical protein